MTPIWHDGPLSALAWDSRSAVVWSVAECGLIAAAHAASDDARSVRQALARALVATLADLPADRIRLTRTAAGAPTVDTPEGWHIGLSSRDGHCLIGLARTPIGVDRELIDAAPPLWDMLTPTEADALRGLPAQTQPAAWLRLWTIKEAHAKLIGEPRRIRPEAIETTIADPVHATAHCEGTSRCWTRRLPGAIETIAQWSTPQ